MARQSDHPITFRQQETQFVMNCWRSSQSCSLVGVGSVGKSNLLQHLTSDDVQQHYLGDIAKSGLFRAINIDPNLFAPMPENSDVDNSMYRFWAGFELLMNRLFMAFYPFEVLGEEDGRAFYEVYQAFQDGSNPLHLSIGLRYFEFGLELFMKRGIRIAFVFDEFEDVLKHMPLRFFLALRGLRDAHKRQLMYLTFTRTPLPEVTQRLGIAELEIEPFVELFTDRVSYVGPYSEADARDMLEKVAKRKNKTYDVSAQEFLLWASGRHAGLLRSGTQVLDHVTAKLNVPAERDQAARQLAAKLPVRTECRTIWKSLSQPEKEMLKGLAQAEPNLKLDQQSIRETFDLLLQKRLVRADGNRVVIDPPVFAAFVSRNPDTD